MIIRRYFAAAAAVVLACGTTATPQTARAQAFGIELHNTMMPAAGGMAGVGIARPQDLQSALNTNPATLTQFRGTQFSFGGGWTEATYDVNQTADLVGIGVSDFNAKSGTPGAALGNIGVTQDLSYFGLPATFGMGFLSNAGTGVDFRDEPNSNGTSAHYIALDIVMATGVEITERLSAGAAFTLGSSFLDGPFVDVGGMVPAYGLRGALGLNYALGEATDVGFYWQTRKEFQFDDAALPAAGPARDVRFDHPENIGIGVANRRLFEGRLLLAADIVFKQHTEADFLGAIYNDQWVYQLGAQYDLSERLVLRGGYAYNDNPMREAQVSSIGGVPLPDGVPGLRYIQGQFAAISQHRISCGVGLRDVLPGLDADLFAGGMFENADPVCDDARIALQLLGRRRLHLAFRLRPTPVAAHLPD